MTRQTRRRPTPRAGRSNVLLWAGAVVLFVIGIYAGFEIAKPPPRPDFGTSQAPPDVGAPAPAPPPAEAAALLTIARQAPPQAGSRPRISIVIDDLGRSLRDLETLGSLGIPLTYSVLPFETYTPQVVAELNRRGAEYICHLPMEARGDADPGPGALTMAMSHDELTAAARRALAAVPGAAGVNNHMGSGMLFDREAMTTVLAVLAEQGLYFLDSRTSADTVGYSLARYLGLRASERQVFLDTERDGELIRAQFAALLAAARSRGGATAIAHPYPETLKVLAAAIPAARAEGFEFVLASALLEG